MTTMAEVINAHEYMYQTLECKCRQWDEGVGDPNAESHPEHVANELDSNGYGHVPTALNEAADVLEREASESSYRDPSYATDAWLEAAVLIRARAAETGADE